jgi:hypothetical protein
MCCDVSFCQAVLFFMLVLPKFIFSIPFLFNFIVDPLVNTTSRLVSCKEQKRRNFLSMLRVRGACDLKIVANVCIDAPSGEYSFDRYVV